MKNVSFCGAVFLRSHSDQKLCIFVQTFRKITIKVRSVRLAQHMLNPSRSLEGLQIRSQTQTDESAGFAGDNFLGLWRTRNSSMKRKARGAYGCIASSTYCPSMRRQNFSTNFTEANSISVTIAPAGDL